MANTPADDLSNALPAAKAMAKLVHDLNRDLGQSEKEANSSGAYAATRFMHFNSMIGSVVTFLVRLATPLILFFLDQITTLRSDCADSFGKIGADVLSELLGTPITVAQINPGSGGAANVAVSKALGSAIYTQLLSEFGPGQPLQPGDGERAAQIFTGYGVNFAVQNAIIGTLMDAGSMHLLQQFREIGVDVARGLGLGRLQRLALGTLLTQVIQKPYTADLAQKYRPDRMSEQQYVHAMNRGGIAESRVRAELARKGYLDEDIEQLLIELETDNTAAQLEGLVRWKLLSQDDVTKQLVRQGMTPAVAQQQVQAIWTLRADGEVSNYANKLATLYAGRQMDEDTYDKLMSPLPLTDDEKHYRKLAAGLTYDYPTHELTWTEIVTAFENGIIDVDYVKQWLQDEGYGLNELIIKLYLLAVKESAFADKQAAAAAKAAKLKTQAAATSPVTAPATPTS